MSYCRWSSDNGRCDLYIYESTMGCWTIHVAGRRWLANPEDAPPILCRDDHGRFSRSGKPIHASYMRYVDWCDANMEQITLPHAGETFNLATPGECADKVEELVAMGYMCPASVVPSLREEGD